MVILCCEDLWFLQDTVSQKWKPILDARIQSLCHYDLNIFAKLKNENPVIGIIFSQTVFFDGKWANLCSYCCCYHPLIELTICFFRTCAVDRLFCVMKHTHLLIVEAFCDWNFFPFNCVPTNLFAFYFYFFNPTVLFLPQGSSLGHIGATLLNKWAPLYWN